MILDPFRYLHTPWRRSTKPFMMSCCGGKSTCISCFLLMLSAQSLTISDVTAQLRCQGCFFGPWAALSQLSRQKNSRMGGAHFCWKYLVYHPPIYTYKLTKRYIYNKYRKKTFYTICRRLMPHSLAMFTDGKLTKQCCWKSSPGFW